MVYYAFLVVSSFIKINVTVKSSTGGCPFMSPSRLNISYIIWSNGITAMSIICADGKQTIVECGMNGEWLDDAMCHQANEEIASGKKNSYLRIIYISCVFFITIIEGHNS